MKLDATIRMLARAEKALKIDGLSIRLQSDESGCVTSFAKGDDIDVFRFDKLCDLAIWLSKPRIAVYNDEGKERAE